jgi:hypothetical protein
MRNKPTMAHAKPTAQNSAETAQARLSGLGACGGKGQSDGVDFGASGAVCDRVKGAPTPLSGPSTRLSPARPCSPILRQNTDSRNPPPLDLTPTQRAIVQAAIETELYTIRKQSAADFRHAQRAIVRECLRLDFLDADARRRLSACPLPSKAEAITELHRLLNFVQ